MAIVFYFIEKEKTEGILINGLKPSQIGNSQMDVGGELKAYILGFLTPKDDLLKYSSSDYACLELDVEITDMYVLNGDLDAIDEITYRGSLIPLEKYKFGTYRRPEIAVTTDIHPDKIVVSNKIIGTPILFESSDKIYKDTIMEDLRTKYKDFDETLLGIFFMMMVSKGRMKLTGQKRYGTKTVYIYEDSSSGKKYTLGIQEE